MSSQKQNLLGLSRNELSRFAEQLGERPYRGNQLFGWLYERGATAFSSMSDLGKAFRERLETHATIQGIEQHAIRTSRHDTTTKFLFALPDGRTVETVLIPPRSAFRRGDAGLDDEQVRQTLCVSTQVGCPLDCAFCATATMGFQRNLTAGEIVDQLLQVRRRTGRRITNIVFMGMGEPLLNYDAVMKAVDIFTHGPRVTARHITISTAGWVDGIARLAAERSRVKLAVSLHSAVDTTRRELMPVGRRFPLPVLEEALRGYYRQTRRRITFEVIFFDGVNDTAPEVGALLKFARRVPCKINVIPFHSIAFAAPAGLGASLRPSPKTDAIVEQLRQAHLTVMVRSSAGEDIEGACGQLAVRGERAHGRPRSAVTTAAP
jgi:23S rRNA (adenine2503-C2)-methyltransferase